MRMAWHLRLWMECMEMLLRMLQGCMRTAGHLQLWMECMVVSFRVPQRQRLQGQEQGQLQSSRRLLGRHARNKAWRWSMFFALFV